jgi:6-pyruvoyl-tetrahydropterin synthase
MACLFVEQLTVLDFSRLDRERGLVGESWIVDLELEGELDDQSMVLDFGDVKRIARQALEDCADHRLLVPRTAEVAVEEAGGSTRVSFPWGGGRVIRVLSPRDAFAFVDAAQLNMACLEPRLVAAVRSVVPDNVRGIRVRLREEERPGHYYRYSHGLRRHAGLCQRIAHGHRSRIEIHRNGARDDGLERAWAARWRDIYIGSAEDLAGETEADGEVRLEFAYDAPHGRYELSIGRDRCEVIPADSTVECIAAHVAGELSGRHPGARIGVRAYEGINKGATAEAGPA